MLGLSTRFLTAAALVLMGTVGTQAAARAGEAGITPAQIDRSAPVTLIYPTDAQVRGEEGNVDISLQIKASGRPTGRYTLINSSGYADLDTAALQSILNWRYTPAHDKYGVPQASWLPVHVEYKLPKAGGAPATN